ncbi:MAG: endo-1,4-beta-xylanase [Phycisphaerae bacterium]
MSLRKLAEERGFLIGAACNPDHLSAGEEEYESTLSGEFNITTAERQMKFAPVQPEQGVFKWGVTSKLTEFTQKHALKLRGHTLTWHHPAQLPNWLELEKRSRNEAIEIMREHIETVVNHFRGDVFWWDVVNEGLAEQGTMYREESPWYRAIGADYIEMAFRFAHHADPDCKLFYNDYEMDAVNDKSDRCHQMVKQLLDKDVPIHGIGLQGHIQLDRAPVIDSIAENIDRFGRLGLEVQFTEVDVWLPAEAGDEALQKQAEYYRDLVGVAVEADCCTAFVTWGVTDKYSWVPKFTDGKYGRALLFDENYHPKPAYHAVVEQLRG